MEVIRRNSPAPMRKKKNNAPSKKKNDTVTTSKFPQLQENNQFTNNFTASLQQLRVHFLAIRCNPLRNSVHRANALRILSRSVLYSRMPQSNSPSSVQSSCDVLFILFVVGFYPSWVSVHASDNGSAFTFMNSPTVLSSACTHTLIGVLLLQRSAASCIFHRKQRAHYGHIVQGWSSPAGVGRDNISQRYSLIKVHVSI